MIRQELEPGIQIEIQRSDGRKHSAVVASVDDISEFVTVEWYENGHTKGKEIRFHSVFILNPHLYSNGLTRPVTSDIEENFSKETLPFLIMDKCSALNLKAMDKMILSPRAEDEERWLDIENIPPLKKVLSEERIKSSVKQPWQRGKAAEEVERIKRKREERRKRTAQKQKAIQTLIKSEKGNPHWLEALLIKEYRQKMEFIPLKISDLVTDHQITVCVRKRPLSPKEKQEKEIDILTIPKKNLIILHEPKMKVDLTKYIDNQTFRFDYAFDEICSNEMVYHFTAGPLVRTIFQRGNATCFAYGQTGSGKTHTMSGSFTGNNLQDFSGGIYALTAADVFKHLEETESHSLNLIVNVSYFEIYRGKVFDLLNRRNKLNVLEDGQQQVQIVGLSELVVESVAEVMKIIKVGNKERTSGKTSANLNSSRSHGVFQIILKEKEMASTYGKFSLIDLAGNERGKDTSAANQLRRMEGGEINKSLLALKECIRALGQKGSHLPFRASKLTQVLKDSFIGENSKICMIAMVSPGIGSCVHSLNTLHYANRVKELETNEVLKKVIQKPTSDDVELEEESITEDEIDKDSLRRDENLLDLYNQWRDCCSKCDSVEKDLFSLYSDKQFENNKNFLEKLDLILKTRQEKLLEFQRFLVIKTEINGLSPTVEEELSSLETNEE